MSRVGADLDKIAGQDPSFDKNNTTIPLKCGLLEESHQPRHIYHNISCYFHREEIPKGVTPSIRIQRGLPKLPRGDQ